MMWILSLLCVLLGIAVAVLSFRLWSLRHSARQLTEQISQWLAADTNQPLIISSHDRRLLELTDELNRQLRSLRREQMEYRRGNRELNDAITSISHDLRTPLTAICGYLELLEREEQSPEVSRYLSYISNRADAMKALTEELFRYSVLIAQPQSLHPEAVDLCGAVEEAVAGFYSGLKAAGIEPTIHLPPERVLCTTDPMALSRILQNILSNALKYSEGDLCITLTGHTLTFSNPTRALDEVTVGRLFDRFFTVDSARNSTGLGLAIAKVLTEQLGGTITADYQDGIFTVRLRLP